MSFGDRLFGSVKDLLVMREEVTRLTASAEKLADIAGSHEVRLVRIETIIEMTQQAAQRRLPRR